MPPNHPQPYDPFRHFNPELWTASKKAHITLFTIGSLLVLPAVYALFMMVMLLTEGFGFGPADIDTETFFGIASVAASTSSGTLAWSALGFLFFKRADARWRRVCWNICAVYGWIGLMSSLGWFIYLIQKVNFSPHGTWDAIFFFGCFLLIILSALACIMSGRRHASAAKRFLQASN